MPRYLVATLLISTLATAPVLWLWQFEGLGETTMAVFHDLYVRLGLVPYDGVPTGTRLLHWIMPPLTALAVAWCAVDIPRPALKLVAVGAIAATLAGMSPSLSFFSAVLHMNQGLAEMPALPPAPVHYWLLEPSSGLAAGLLALIGGLLYGRTNPGKRKRLLGDLAGGRMSRASLHRWIGGADSLPLKGGMRELTVLHCRIFNMAELQANLSAEELLRASNEFLRAAGDFLLARGAFLDESATDGVRVVFGIPEPENSASDACAAALELRVRLNNLGIEHESRWNQKPAFGVGLASGDIAVGLFGATDSGRLGIVGALLEKSRRLCDANESIGSQLLIDSRTRELAGSLVEVRPLDIGSNLGGDPLQEGFELLATRGELDSIAKKQIEDFSQGVLLLREGYGKKALECFLQIRDTDQNDPALEHMIKQAVALIDGPVSPANNSQS